LVQLQKQLNYPDAINLSRLLSKQHKFFKPYFLIFQKKAFMKNNTSKLADLNLNPLENSALVKGGTTSGSYQGPCGGTINYAYGSATGTGANGNTGTVYYGGAHITGANGTTASVGGAVGVVNGGTAVRAVGGIKVH
jgi:hypothetical protein